MSKSAKNAWSALWIKDSQRPLTSPSDGKNNGPRFAALPSDLVLALVLRFFKADCGLKMSDVFGQNRLCSRYTYRSHQRSGSHRREEHSKLMGRETSDHVNSTSHRSQAFGLSAQR